MQPPDPEEARSLVSVSVSWVRPIVLTTDDTCASRSQEPGRWRDGPHAAVKVTWLGTGASSRFPVKNERPGFAVTLNHSIISSDCGHAGRTDTRAETRRVMTSMLSHVNRIIASPPSTRP